MRAAEVLDFGGGPDSLGALGRLADAVAQLLEPVFDGCGAGRIAAGELILEVGQRGGGGSVEGDRLLDLEVERDARPLDAAAVFDGDEREEAQQLLGAARGLLGAQWRSREALEPGGHVVACGTEHGHLTGGARRGELGEPSAESVGSRSPAILGITRCEDRPVRGRLRGGLGEPRRKAALGSHLGVAQQVPLAALVGIEQVLLDRLRRRGGRDPPALQAAQRQRGVGTRPGHARGGAKLAQQQPGASGPRRPGGSRPRA